MKPELSNIFINEDGLIFYADGSFTTAFYFDGLLNCDDDDYVMYSVCLITNIN